jgi:hypothetical protein
MRHDKNNRGLPAEAPIESTDIFAFAPRCWLRVQKLLIEGTKKAA